jgi:hypothetical protein
MGILQNPPIILTPTSKTLPSSAPTNAIIRLQNVYISN